MKYNKTTKYIHLRAAYLLRKRIRSQKKKKQRNILKYRRDKHKKDRVTKNYYTNRVENISIDGGKDLTLFSNPNNIIEIVNRIDKYKKIGSRQRNIRIDLSKIESIDLGGISFLLAKINELSKIQRIRVWGDTPINENCKKVFYESGILDYMTDLSGNKFNKQSENFIVNVGTDKTRNEKVGKTIEKSLKHLTGIEQKYPPVYSIVQEICSNSVEWANPKFNKNINWLLGVSYNFEQIPTVTYIMTDVGFGIVNTLNRKFGTYIKESLQITKDTDVLHRAFERKYGSKSGEANRNRGLPLIKDRFLKSYIKDLIVITNNVHLDFNSFSNSKIIDRNLPGTLYCWKIDLKCIEIWNQLNAN